MTPEEAAVELLRRRRARESLIAFAQAVEIPGAPVADDQDAWLFKPVETEVAAHHRVTMAAIQRAIEADYGRLMIFEPPGSAKSTYASVVAPAWAMGKFPGLRVLMASYAAAPAERQSKRCRQLVDSELAKSIWDGRPGLVQGSTSAHEWELTNGSGFVAAGIMGAVTSLRADLAIIDDPVAGREEADSETMRRKIRQEYQDSILTRLKPKASVILIQTRWHLDDLAGSILPEDYKGESGPVLCRDGMVWEVLNIQAKCERNDDPLGRQLGEYLWPEWFGPQHWAIYESQPRTWSALYQQRPTLAEGGQFKAEWFTRYDELDEDTLAGIRWLLPGDWAVTDLMESENPDFTELGVIGVDHAGNVYCEDGWSGQKTIDVSIDAYLNLARRYKAKTGIMERGVIKNSVEPILEREMQDRGPYVVMEYLTTNGDKTAMAQASRALAASGKVKVKQGAWGNRLIEQLTAFPYSSKDDMVDMFGLVGRYIDQARTPKRDKSEIKRQPPPKLGKLPARVVEGYDAEDRERQALERRFRA